MSKFTKDEIEAKIKRLDAVRNQIKKWETEAAALVDELAPLVPVDKSITAGGLTLKHTERVNWRSLDKGRVMKDYPLEDFPQIYIPDYKGTKELLAQLKPEADNPVADYCGVSQYFVITKVSAQVAKRVREGTRVGGTPVRRTVRKR